jgi:deoxyribodipyrimidine photo-lyase
MRSLVDYDINGDYIKHWLPELSQVPADKLFQPWLLTAEDQARYSVRIGPGLDYPALILPDLSAA